jgi:TRAP-type mannitol/chloroaromatic compound transport system permease large subunit
VPLLLALVTLGTTWWYVVIYSQKDDRPAVTATQPADAQVARTGTAQALPGPAPADGGLQEPPGAASTSAGSSTLQEPPGSAAPSADAASEGLQRLDVPQGEAEHVAVPPIFYTGFWIVTGLTVLLLLWYYRRFDAEQFEILRMLTSSVMPLALLTFVVLAVILFGITTATESAGVGAAGAFLMAWQARTLNWQKTKEAVFLTAKTTAMVCWLFIGSAIFSAVFAILGGQSLVERWVLSFDLTPMQFMLLSQAIIFVLGWPLEWTEIIVIFVPIFLPLLQHFQIDPMLWGVLVFVNLQAAFLSPPVAMSAFYLKGVSPPHVTINQIFAGMMPYMLIVIVCMVLMYIWPQLTLWLPNYLYH